MSPHCETSPFECEEEIIHPSESTMTHELKEVMRYDSLERSMLMRYVIKLHGSRPNAELVAEDVVNRVMTKAWKVSQQKPHLLPTTCSLSTWLHSICRNTYFDSSRRQKRIEQRELSSSGEHYFEESGDTTSSSIEEIDQNERRIGILNAIKQLPQELQEVLLSLAIDKLSYVNISEKFNIPTGTVKTRIFRARKQLKELLNQSL